MPIVSHVSRILSRSIMLSVSRYKTGIAFVWAVMSINFFIGESICFPVANQDVSSHTQKSGSVWTAIACFFVTIISSMLSNGMFAEFKYSDIGLVLFCGRSNVISENVGAEMFAKLSVLSAALLSGSKSKSVGNGISSISAWGVGMFGWTSMGVGFVG